MKYKLIATFGFVLTGMLTCAQGAPVQENWDQHCAKCHGPDGKGATKMGQKLGVKDYTDPQVQAKFTDEEAFKAIKEGISEEGKKKMQAFGEKLSDDDIHALVKHVRSFKKAG